MSEPVPQVVRARIGAGTSRVILPVPRPRKPVPSPTKDQLNHVSFIPLTPAGDPIDER